MVIGQKGVTLDPSHGSGWAAEITLAPVVTADHRSHQSWRYWHNSLSDVNAVWAKPITQHHITIIYSSIKATFCVQLSWILRDVE